MLADRKPERWRQGAPSIREKTRAQSEVVGGRDVTLQQGVPGDAVPWPGARGCPLHLPFFGPPQAGTEGDLKSYSGTHNETRADPKERLRRA